MENDSESGNRNAFKLGKSAVCSHFLKLKYQTRFVCVVFEESDISYWFMANSAKDQDEWSTALSSGRYVCL